MPLTQAAQTIADNFTAGLTADQRTNFNNSLQNSPALVAQINGAVASGDLTRFAALPAGANAGGRYDPTSRTMELPLSIMTTPTTPAGARFDAGELTFVMGHEIQHAINRPTLAAAYTTFDADVNRIGRSAQAVHDYTAPLNTLLTANRNDESTANIAGYNATVGMLRSTNGNRNPTYEELYRANPGRMQDIISVTPGTPATYGLRAGYTLNADMTMTANAANTQAMGQHYYDMPAARARLGANGDSNYQNYYAANPLSTIAQVELANAPAHAAAGINPQLHLNMTTLGINEAQLERNGLNLGAAGARQPYYDTSSAPPRQGNFDHTAGTNRHVPIVRTEPPSHDHDHGHGGHDHRHAPATRGEAQPPAQGAPATEATPGVRQAMDALDRSPNIPADAFGADRARVAAGIALHAADQRLSPDHVVLNDRRTDLVIVQGNLGDPTARLSTPLSVAEAIRTDPAVAQQRLDAAPTVDPARLGAMQQDVAVQEAPKPGR